MGSVIKAGQIPSDEHARSDTRFHLQDVARQARGCMDDIRRQAEQQAEQIVTKAKDEAEQIRQQAIEQGHKAAIQTAEETSRAQLQENLKTLLPAINSIAEEMQNQRLGWTRQWENNVVHLATKIAERVIRRELKDDINIPLELIRDAIQMASTHEKLQHRLSPEDLEALGEEIGQIILEIGRLDLVEPIADPTLSRGGCLLTTVYGSIDQRIESQLARIEEELT